MALNESSNITNMVQKIKFVWDVHDVDSYKFKPGECISEWKLFLYPGGYDTSSKNKMALGLRETSQQNLKILEKCSFYILNHEREIIETFTEGAPALGKELYCSLIFVDKKGHQCNWASHEETLSILCELDLSIAMETMDRKTTKAEHMKCTSVVKKESTVSSLVSSIATEKSVTMPFGKGTITIFYHQIQHNMAFYLSKNEKQMPKRRP